jgi:L-threonylcarbamoyladenylate synthase
MRRIEVHGAGDPETVALAAEALARGGLVIYPTDTLYALGCRALDEDAVGRLRGAKRRDEGKPLPLVAADTRQAQSLWTVWPREAAILAQRFWPGPLTLVLPAAPAISRGVTAGRASVAVRVPARALTRALCAAAGPLVSTSANSAGEQPALTCADALRALGDAVALALDGGAGVPNASTLLDLTDGAPRMLREGDIPWLEVARLLNIPQAC